MPWNKIASLFIETEEDPEEKKGDNGASTEPVTAEAPPVSPAPPPPSPMPSTAVIAGVNEEMAEILSNAIEAADLEGFDYLEFRNALAGMAHVPMPEKQRFQAVFATAKTMGVTKDKLIVAVDHYHGVIEEKKSEFGAHVEAMIAQEVTAREQLQAQKEQEIATLSEQIQQATAAIREKQSEIGKIKNEIYEQKTSIQQTASSFEATYNFISGKLQEDKGKIQTYLAE